MSDVKICKSCGYVSCRETDFTLLKDVFVCKRCERDYNNGDELVVDFIDGFIKCRSCSTEMCSECDNFSMYNPNQPENESTKSAS